MILGISMLPCLVLGMDLTKRTEIVNWLNLVVQGSECDVASVKYTNAAVHVPMQQQLL